ncbi:MAG: 2,4'-dihydroxyacetophenone dioxygenase family protein [Microthrixaceae bacterium]
MTVTDSAADPTQDVDTTVCHTNELPWAELAPGIEMKVLRTGAGTDRYTLMNRFAPGTVLPKHYHHGEVHAWTIDGTWGYLEYDWSASAGDYIYEPAGSVHTLAVPADADGPATIQFVIEKGLDFLDDDGNAFHVEDAETITALYVDTLAAAGIERPAILP